VARRALVVGAALGIGRATARHLASTGHRVTATWHRTEPAPDPALTWVRCDTTDPASVDALFAEAAADDDPYDVVVANAAIVRDRLSSRMTDDDFTAVVDVNLTGTFRIARAALAPMAARRWGRIVIVSSVGGWYGNAGQANYAAAKAGQLGMARALAREAGPRGVTVNVLAPGAIDTELIAAMSPKLRERFLRMVPAQRWGTPDEIASAIGFLASERAGFITGALVPVDGGCLA
jgi:NAD(P)-dependent dehydrogenase (short-subunit alcohol dehydrogenase family)